MKKSLRRSLHILIHKQWHCLDLPPPPSNGANEGCFKEIPYQTCFIILGVTIASCMRSRSYISQNVASGINWHSWQQKTSTVCWRRRYFPLNIEIFQPARFSLEGGPLGISRVYHGLIIPREISPQLLIDKAISSPFIWGLWTPRSPSSTKPPPNPPNPPGFRDGNLVHRRKDLLFAMGEAAMG